ncbi:hypothetical protein AB0M38_00360 [Streptomyces sp. NPDC051742]|uniref:hypothetical protein n=1 Tax=unclassified Streptomyces TaxID=2593676 RepID=UPI00342A4215
MRKLNPIALPLATLTDGPLAVSPLAVAPLTVTPLTTARTQPLAGAPRPLRELPRAGRRQAPARTRIHAPRRTY